VSVSITIVKTEGDEDMTELAPIIKDLALILAMASIAIVVCQSLKQPVVLGYLIVGIIVGPHTPPYSFVTDIKNVRVLAELGVIFLMFSLGLDFSFQKICRVGLSAMVTGFLEVAIMILLGYGLGRLIGWSTISSLFLGAALSISSTTIIIKTLTEMHLKRRNFAEIVIGVLIIEDLLAILLLASLPAIATTDNYSFMSTVYDSIELLLIVSSWFVIGYFVVPYLFRKAMEHATQETLTILSIACCLIFVCLAAYCHYSTALGAFIMGSILAETPQVHRIEKLLQPLRDIFAAVFFVSVGMLIDPSVIYHHYSLILLISLITILGKIFSTCLGGMATGQSLSDSLRVGFSMTQIGEFSFIIISMGVALHATNTEVYPIIVAVSAITTFITPYFISLSGPVALYMEKIFPPKILQK
jgi:CPA2 family monovalent cation:H+ antiporter-2